jgi:hypothetical protein
MLLQKGCVKGPFGLFGDARGAHAAAILLLVEMSARALCGREGGREGVTNAPQLISRSDDRGATLQSMGPPSRALA